MKISLFGKQAELKTEAVVVGAAILALLGCLIGYLFFRDNGEIIIEAGKNAVTSEAADTEKAAGTTGTTGTAGAAGAAEAAGSPGIIGGAEQGFNGESQAPDEALIQKELIKVYVVGCVNKPGIVTLEKGQLIDDAVRKAGGLTGEADADNINMVYELNENTMLYIRSKKEMESKKATATGAAETQIADVRSTGVDSSLGKGAVIIKDSGDSAAVIGNGEGDGENDNGTGKPASVNINTASADELDTLPGIGEATAKDIISFRETNGPFRKIEDIMKVPRIKKNRFESIKKFIYVD